jgi:hypothetical protein
MEGVSSAGIPMIRSIRLPALFILLFILMSCTSTSSPNSLAKDSCPSTQAVWLKPAPDSAVQPEPGYGYYFVGSGQVEVI